MDHALSLRRNVLMERMLKSEGKKPEEARMLTPPVLAASTPQPSLRASDMKPKPLVDDTDLASHKAKWQVSGLEESIFSFASHETSFWNEAVRLL